MYIITLICVYAMHIYIHLLAFRIDSHVILHFVVIGYLFDNYKYMPLCVIGHLFNNYEYMPLCVFLCITDMDCSPTYI